MVLLGAAVLVAGCEGDDCDRPIKDCDGDGCYVVQALKVERDGCQRRQAATCSVPGGGDDVMTPAYRVSDGSCWVFPNTFIPRGFRVLSDGNPCEAKVAASRFCAE
jgi:hypothetical protein